MYSNPSKPQTPNQSAFTEAAQRFSVATAIMAVVFSWPPAFEFTSPYVCGFVAKHYPSVIADLSSVVWSTLLAFSLYQLYQLSRMFLMTTITTMAIYIAARVVI